MLGNRSLDIATSRFSITLSSAAGQHEADSSRWRFINPTLRNIDPKYQSCVVMMRSFYVVNAAADAARASWFPTVPLLAVSLEGAHMQNNTQGLNGVSRTERLPAEGGAVPGNLQQSTVLGVVPLKRLAEGGATLDASTDYVDPSSGQYNLTMCCGAHFDGDVASRGKLCAGTLVNDELTVAVSMPTGLQWNAADSAALWLKSGWVLELDVQLLTNATGAAA